MHRAGIFVVWGVVLGSAIPSLAQQQALEAQEAVPNAQSAELQLNIAQGIVSRGERLSSRIATMITQAQAENDIIRVNCLDDKLAQSNANLRTAKARLEVLQTQTDSQIRAQAVTVLRVLGQKFQVLDQEASQCVGQNLFETGSTRLETQIDSTLVPQTADDTTIVPSLIPPAAPGTTETQTPPPPEEVSGNS